jgi:hypothetical protein
MNKKALIKAVKELLRLVVLAIPALAIQVITNDPSLTAQYGVPVLFVLKAVDRYIHENPSIDKNGLLPF